MSKEGALLAKIYELDRSRSGYQAVLSRVCKEIEEKLIQEDNLEAVKLLQSRLNTAFDRYQQCCRKYDDLLDHTCEKYRNIQELLNKQLRRKEYIDQKINMFIASAMVNLEVTRIEEEIKQTETELKQALERGKSVSGGRISAESSPKESRVQQTVLQDSNNPDEENIQDVFEFNVIIPPPPMFSDVITPEPPKREREPIQVITSTPIISTYQTTRPVLKDRVRDESKISSEGLSSQSTVLQDNYSPRAEDLQDLLTRVISSENVDTC